MSTTLQNQLTPAGHSPPTSPGASNGAATRSRFWRALPNVLTVAALALVFFYGHHTGWQLPRISGLFASAPAAGDWCPEHLVPDSQCVECKPELLGRAKEYGFCAKHGVAECVLCHPELSQAAGDPRTPQYDTLAALALIPRGENNSRNMLHKRRVQLASAAAAERVGIEVDMVQERPVNEAITANGEIKFDPTRVAHLSSRSAGSVAVAFKHLGDRVKAGDILALVDAVQVGQTKSQLLQAIVQSRARKVNYERFVKSGDGVAAIAVADAKTALQEAEVALISARQALVNLGLEVPDEFADASPQTIADSLRFLGIPADVLKGLPAPTLSANLIAIRAVPRRDRGRRRSSWRSGQRQPTCYSPWPIPRACG